MIRALKDSQPSKNKNPMNAELNLVQTNLGKVNEITTRQRELETKQGELKEKIKTLTAAVAAGDAKVVNDLAVATARAGQMPSELAAVARQYDEAIAALRNTLPALSPMVARAYGDEVKNVKARVKLFLQSLLDEGHLVEEFTLQIVNNAKMVKDLDYLNTRFSALRFNLNGNLDAKAIIARAKDAIKSLSSL